jgi:hypothetical protein
MINLDNLLIWDGELTPTRIPRIAINPDIYSALAEDDKWIVCGKWRIKISIAPSASGLSLSSVDGTVKISSSSGSQFLDESFFDIQPADGSVAVLGRIRGSIDISW